MFMQERDQACVFGITFFGKLVKEECKFAQAQKKPSDCWWDKLQGSKLRVVNGGWNEWKDEDEDGTGEGLDQSGIGMDFGGTGGMDMEAMMEGMGGLGGMGGDSDDVGDVPGLDAPVPGPEGAEEKKQAVARRACDSRAQRRRRRALAVASRLVPFGSAT